MDQINKNIRNCATCAYWCGYRNPHRLGYVEVFSRMEGGRCVVKGLNEKRQYQAIYCCNNYSQWQAIK